MLKEKKKNTCTDCSNWKHESTLKREVIINYKKNEKEKKKTIFRFSLKKVPLFFSYLLFH